MATTILANIWIQEFASAGSGSIPNAMMKGLASYISTYVKFNIAYAGITPTGEPVTGVDVMNLNGKPVGNVTPVFTLPTLPNGMYSDGGPEWILWMQQVYAGIDLAMISKGTLTEPLPPLPGFIMVTPTWTRDALKSAYLMDVNNPQGNVLDEMARNIMKDMRSFHQIAFPAIYGTSTGAATVTSVLTP